MVQLLGQKGFFLKVLLNAPAPITEDVGRNPPFGSALDGRDVGPLDAVEEAAADLNGRLHGEPRAHVAAETLGAAVPVRDG
jgi:hypothetical protein